MKALSVIYATFRTMMWLGFVLLISGCGTDSPFDSDSSGFKVDSTVEKVTIGGKGELANTPIPVGRELTLDADATNKDGFNISLGTELGGGGQPVSMQWSSSNSKVATIKQGGKFGNSGVLRAIARGVSEICVEASSVKDCVQITVR